jgi:hypothetical protein
MEPESRSPRSWFFIGLLATLTVCFLAASFIVGVSWVVRTVASLDLSPDQPAGLQDGGQAPTGTPGSGVAPGGTDSPQTGPGSVGGSGDLAMAEETLETLSAMIVPINDRIALAERLLGLSDVPEVLAEEAPDIPLGSLQTFWAKNLDDITNFQVQAELAYATEHVYLWIETGIRYDPEDVQALVEDFETKIYPTNRAFFGSEWSPGVDGDPHLYILYARGLGNSVAGYYAAGQEYSPLAYEFSNGHEMFFLNADAVFLWERQTAGILAHEFQHMIHWYQDSNEESWLNEGFSELAALLNGYYDYGFDQIYVPNPDIPLTLWPGAGQSGPHYGQSFLFVSYFLDRFGAETTKAVVRHDANGLDSIDQVLESQEMLDEQRGVYLQADDVYADWAAALWLDDPTVGDGRYAFQTYSPPAPRETDRFRDCPVETQYREVNQYGLDFIHFSCEGEYQLEFEGASLAPVLPADPHSGDYAFWSNRGDSSDMTLTRSFDFNGVEAPIQFEYWVWYDIEEGWDYAYLEASLDGGESWQILTTPSGTDMDPSGNAYGWAYTSFSGGGNEAVWVQESIDLSDYAGEQVLLRFEYITDDAVNGEGLLLDDLAIDALGYREDFEAGAGGWEAAGFVRIYNLVPQTYKVMLVEQGSQPRVRELTLDENQHATADILLGGEYDGAVLIVIGTARHTWQLAPYSFRLTP